MNDFTIEELHDLLEWGNTYCTDMPTISKMHHSNLIGKIESMIDNYCMHAEKETIQTSAAKSVFVNRCKKCKKVI